MNKDLENKIQVIINDAKQYAANYTCDKLLKNGVNNLSVDVWNEYARQIDKTNVIRQKKKDLSFLNYILTEAKYGLSNNAPSEQKILKQIKAYMDIIKQLIITYTEMENIQNDIVYYYNKGGGVL